jgi:oligogalacturonide lyase
VITEYPIFSLRTLAVSAALSFSAVLPAIADTPASAGKEPPTSWVDPDTGHRVVRLTREPGSASFYFNDNGYTPDGKEMVYNTPEGISVLNLATLEARSVVQGPVRSIIVGRKTPTIYYTKATDKPLYSSLWSTNVDTGETHELAELPRRGNISAINADETIAAGTYIEGDATAGGNYDGMAKAGQTHELNMPANKLAMMAVRLAARLPITMYTVNLNTKAVTILLNSTDWLNHLEFSPTDPTLLMYCHEGVKVEVDRIWTIRTDGTQNTLIHKRTMEMEGPGHEWWSRDGKTIWYDLNFGRHTYTDGKELGLDHSDYTLPVVGYVAGYNVQTGARIWYHYQSYEWSIHFNSSPDDTIFCGDGGRTPGAQWLYLFRPERLTAPGMITGSSLIRMGLFHSERLVNMSKHDYRLEPNVSFTPDAKFIVFRSNMFGPTYAFAVEVAKASTPYMNVH